MLGLTFLAIVGRKLTNDIYFSDYAAASLTTHVKTCTCGLTPAAWG